MFDSFPGVQFLSYSTHASFLRFILFVFISSHLIFLLHFYLNSFYKKYERDYTEDSIFPGYMVYDKVNNGNILGKLPEINNFAESLINLLKLNQGCSN